MCYQDCTTADIGFLRTCIVGIGNSQPKLAEKIFQNMSIITAWNAQKDKINKLGCIRFAKEIK